MSWDGCGRYLGRASGAVHTQAEQEQTEQSLERVRAEYKSRTLDLPRWAWEKAKVPQISACSVVSLSQPHLFQHTRHNTPPTSTRALPVQVFTA